MRLRELRRQADLSGKRLAESLGWPASKISKLENGRQTPSDHDIRMWTQATDSTSETESLLASLHTLETQYAEWQRVLRSGLRPRQNQLIEWDQKTRNFRAFETTVIPGLLQTAGYARTRFVEGSRRLKVPNDIDEAVQGRLRRQEILYRTEKQFHFLLTEAALRFRLCPPEVMLGQLDRLLALSQLPNVRLGVLAFSAEYTVSPWHGFWIYDDERVLIETYSAALDLRQPQEIELYSETFEQLALSADYGRDARKIIHRAIEELTSDHPDL
ncbi:helix-turn-helix transcriptional regulator [Nocardiopsis alba]|uniref:helix-turn-helix domain-containing protein n=1 Tax=Nocardiopsis alba TaxID=53437 RepID=UPI0033D441C8